MSESSILHMAVMKIGPYEANAMLNRNYDGNRHIRESKVNELANMMLRGQYMLNGESIIIHEDGTLLDGQHRLAAVVKSGVSVDFLIVTIRGDKKGLYVTMDNGTKRIPADFIEHKNKNNMASIAKIAYCIDFGAVPLASAMQGRTDSDTQASKIDIVGYANGNPLISDCVTNAMRMRNAVGKGPVKAFGTFLYVVSVYGYADGLSGFIEDFCSDMPEDRTVAALIGKIRKLYLANSKPSEKSIVGYLFNAYDHYLMHDGATMLNKWEQSFNRYDRMIKAAKEVDAA